MIKLFEEEAGVTLIELLLTITILSIIAVTAYNAYFSSINVFGFNRDRILMQRAQDLSESWISSRVRSATGIEFNSDQDELTLLNVDSDSHRFYLNNNYLYVDINGVPRQISDLKFNSLEFSFDNNSVEMVAEIKNGNKTYKFSSVFFPRKPNVSVTP